MISIHKIYGAHSSLIFVICGYLIIWLLMQWNKSNRDRHSFHVNKYQQMDYGRLNYKKGLRRSRLAFTSTQKLAMFSSSSNKVSTMLFIVLLLLVVVSSRAHVTYPWPTVSSLIVNQPYYSLFYLPYHHDDSTSGKSFQISRGIF